MKDSVTPKAVLLVILLTLIWGTSFILIKQGLKALYPDEVGALRVSAAALFMLPLALTRLRGLAAADYLKFFVSGCMGILIPPFLFAAAQTHIDSSVAGVLNTLSPIWTLIWGVTLFHQRVNGYAVLGILIAFAGAVILAVSRATVDFSGLNGYALLIVLACAFYGANLNFIKYKLSQYSSLTVAAVSVLMVGPVALIYLLLGTDFSVRVWEAEGALRSAGFVVLLGVMGTSVATMLFNKLVKLSTPLFSSSVTYLMPVVSMGWGLLDHEPIFAGHIIGLVAILSGVYLVSRK